MPLAPFLRFFAPESGNRGGGAGHRSPHGPSRDTAAYRSSRSPLPLLLSHHESPHHQPRLTDRRAEAVEVWVLSKEEACGHVNSSPTLTSESEGLGVLARIGKEEEGEEEEGRAKPPRGHGGRHGPPSTPCASFPRQVPGGPSWELGPRTPEASKGASLPHPHLRVCRGERSWRGSQRFAPRKPVTVTEGARLLEQFQRGTSTQNCLLIWKTHVSSLPPPPNPLNTLRGTRGAPPRENRARLTAAHKHPQNFLFSHAPAS